MALAEQGALPGSRARGGAAPRAGDLSGITAIVTRAREQAGSLVEALEALGARVIASPAIRFTEPVSWEPFDRAVVRAGGYDWVILTSVNGVAAVEERLGRLGRDWSSFGRARFAAIGPATAEALARRSVDVALVPEEFRAEGILLALGSEDLAGRRILIARAEMARDLLPEELVRRGGEVDVVKVYRTLPCEPVAEAVAALQAGLGGHSLLVVFTSPSTVAGFVDGLHDEALQGLRAATLAAIGPVTGEALARRGLRPAVQPASYTVASLVDEIRAHFAAR